MQSFYANMELESDILRVSFVIKYVHEAIHVVLRWRVCRVEARLPCRNKRTAAKTRTQTPALKAVD